MQKKPPAQDGDLGQAIRNRFAPLGGVELPQPQRGPIPDPEALYRDAEDDPDRRDAAADWDGLPLDEAL